MAKRKPKNPWLDVVVPVRVVLRYEIQESDLERRVRRMKEPTWTPILVTLGGGISMDLVEVDLQAMQVQRKQ